MCWALFAHYFDEDMVPNFLQTSNTSDTRPYSTENGVPGGFVKSSCVYGNGLSQITMWSFASLTGNGTEIDGNAPTIGATWDTAAESLGIAVEIAMQPSGA